MNIQYFTYSKQ